MNKNDFFQIIKNNAALAEKMLEKKLDIIKQDSHYAMFSTLEDSMRYSLMAGGKRLRPCLVIEFAKLFGATAESALDYACSLEMIHTASLIHDDMPCMDNDELRRGKPTNHVAFGEACALLAGDSLILFAFETLASEHLSDTLNVKALNVISKLSGPCGMCGGQQIDLENESKKIDIKTLETLHEKKTGALIRAACALGCIAAGKYEGTQEYEDGQKYASAIGLAFQIADDILDVIGDEAKLGKKIGSDERDQKNTYVSLLGLDKAKELAMQLVCQAKNIISAYPNSEFLCALADYVVSRDN